MRLSEWAGAVPDRAGGGGGGAAVRAVGVAVGRERRVILRGIDLTVSSGERVALVGANGCGKTTLLRALAGLDRPLAGEICWQGGALPAGAARVRAVGVLFQGEAAPAFTVAELATLGLGLDRAPGPAEHDRVRATLARVGLTGLADRPCSQLSGGEWQQAALARALVGGARLLLLDEPSTHLDPARRAWLGGLLDGLRPEISVVLATHDLDQAVTCDRVLLLGRGAPVALGTPTEVLTPAWLARALGVKVKRLDDPEGGPPLFRIVGDDRGTT